MAAGNQALGFAIRAVNEAKKVLDEVEEGVKKTGDEAEKADGKVSRLGGAMDRMKDAAKTAAVGLAAISAVGIGAGVALFKLGENFDDAFDTIAIGTGASGKALEALQQDFKRVFASTPTDMASASTAIADINTRLGLTGEELQHTAKTALEMSRITGTDLAKNIETASKLTQAWNLSTSDAASVMDKLFIASQSTGVPMEQLAESVRKFSPAFQELGLGIDESVALLASLDKAGVSSDVVMAGLRKGIVELTKDGKDAKAGILETFNAIRDAKTPTEALSAAIDVFGSKAGVDIANAVRSGKLSVEDLTLALENSGGAILDTAARTADFGERWQVLKNRALTALEPIASKVLGIATEGIDKVAPAVETLARGFGALATLFVDKGIPAINGFLGPVREAVEVLGTFRDYITFTWQEGDHLNDFLADMPPALKPIVREIGGLVGAFKEELLPELQRFADWFRSNKTAMTAAGVAVGTILAGAFIALAVAAGAAAVAMVAAALPVIALVAAVGALGAGVYLLIQNWDQIVERWPMAGEIVDAVKERLATFVDFIKTTVVPLVQELATVVGEAMAKAAEWVQYHWDSIQRIIEGALVVVGAILDGALTAIMGLIEGQLTILTGIVNTVMGILTGDWGRAWEGIKGIVEGIWISIKAVVDGAFTALKGTFTGGLEILKGVWNIGWSAIRDWFGELWTGIKNTASSAMDSLKEKVSTVIDDIKGLGPKMLEAASELGGKMLEGIKNGLSATGGFVSEVAGELLAALKTLVNNHIITPINRAMEFSIGGSVFGKDFSIDINPPDIPHLAAGGIVTRPTLALIGEAGPEAVIPLSKAGRGAGGVHIDRIEVNVNGPADASTVGSIKRGIWQAMDEWWDTRSRQSFEGGAA